jgi:stearoyl-CoA desaturase (delta-9 desaturase)
MRKLRTVAPQDARLLRSLKRWLNENEKMVPDSGRRQLAEVLPKSGVLLTMVTMRRELAAVWGRSAATREQLVKQLQDWCQRAESSGIRPLVEFSRRLRQYA